MKLRPQTLILNCGIVAVALALLLASAVLADKVIYVHTDGTQQVYIPADSRYSIDNQPYPVSISVTRPSGAVGQWVPQTQPAPAPSVVPPARPPVTVPVVTPPPVAKPQAVPASQPAPLQDRLNAGGDAQLSTGSTTRLTTYLAIVKDGTTLEAVGDPAKGRPVISVPEGMALWIAGRSNVTIRGIELVADKPTNVGIGISGGGGILIDSCSIHGFTFGWTAEGTDKWPAANVVVNGLIVQNCLICDNWIPAGHSTGGYADLVNGLQLLGNVYDHNGWGPAGQNQFSENQGQYCTGRCGPIVARGNVFSRSANFGLQARPGGEVTGNLFLDNPNGISHGAVNGEGPVHPGGTVGTVSGNAVIGSPPCGPDPGANGILVGNSHAVTVTGNIVAAGPKSQSAAIFVSPCLLTLPTATTPGNAYVARKSPDGVVNGIDSLVVSNNIIAGWAGGETKIDPRLVKGAAGPNGYRALQIVGNGAPAHAVDYRLLLGADDPVNPAWKRFRDGGAANLPAVMAAIFAAGK